MTLRFQNATLPVVCLLVSAQAAAAADLKSTDVWENFQAYVGGFGGTLSATSKITGNLTEFTEIEAHFTIPFGMGELTLVQSGMSLREAGDGSVEVIYPSDLTYRIAADITGEGAFDATIAIDFDAMTTSATGEPGNIRYEYTADQITGELTEWNVPPELVDMPVEMAVDVMLRDLSGQTTVKTGELVTVTGSINSGEQSFKTRFSGPDGMSGTSDTHIAELQTEVDFALPAGGSDIMNLAAAMKAGLHLQATSTTEGYTASQSQTAKDSPAIEQSSGYDSSTSTLTLDRNGFSGQGTGAGFFASFMIPDLLPVPVRMDGRNVTMSMAVPLEASEAPKPVSMSMNLEDLTLSDDIWAIFDPAQALPRDPARIKMDLSGTMRNLVDLLDFTALTGLTEGGTSPVEAHSADINALVIDAVGAKLTATGGVTFDNEDLETYGGMPKPVGAFDVTIAGANTLLDTLVSMGLLSDQDAGGARMGMAMIAKPDPEAGEDALKSRFEFTEDGGVLANGIQLK